MGVDVIKSYLVSLGFSYDQAQLLQFDTALKFADHAVSSSVGGMLGNFLKFQIGATGALAAVGFGIVGYIDKLAMSDQQTRLFALRSFQTLGQARSIQMALKALDASIEDVAWDKELHHRFEVLIDDQRQLSRMLGPQYEKQMMQVRDIQFEFQRLELKGEYFGMKFAGDLLKKLGIGDGNLLTDLRKLNDFVLQNMPQWSEEISTDVVPVLHDLWDILKGLGGLAKDLGLEFTNLIGVFSGDDSIQGTTFDFHKFAAAVEKVAHWMALLVEYMIKAERIATRFLPLIAGLAGGATVGGAVGTVVGGIAGIPGGPAGILAGAVTGGAAGTGIGTTVGGVIGGAITAAEEVGRYRNQGGVGAAAGREASSVAQQARLLAARVSGETGIPANLIYGQWAHETGNFSNRGTTQLNNLAGIRYSGSTEYRKFDSVDDFAKFYERVIEEKRYTNKGINQAKTPEDFAHALKGGGYYEGKEDVYARGVRSFGRDYAPPEQKVIIGTINVPITTPGATQKQIAAAVQQGVSDGLKEHTQQQIVELGGAYH